MSKVSEPMERTDTSGFPKMKMLSIFLNLEKKKQKKVTDQGYRGQTFCSSIWSLKGKATDGNR